MKPFLKTLGLWLDHYLTDAPTKPPKEKHQKRALSFLLSHCSSASAPLSLSEMIEQHNRLPLKVRVAVNYLIPQLCVEPRHDLRIEQLIRLGQHLEVLDEETVRQGVMAALRNVPIDDPLWLFGKAYPNDRPSIPDLLSFLSHAARLDNPFTASWYMQGEARRTAGLRHLADLGDCLTLESLLRSGMQIEPATQRLGIECAITNKRYRGLAQRSAMITMLEGLQDWQLATRLADQLLQDNALPEAAAIIRMMIHNDALELDPSLAPGYRNALIEMMGMDQRILAMAYKHGLYIRANAVSV